MSTPPRGRGDGILGRRRELEALGGWLDASRHGAGRLVLCVGEPGIGKTRLAQELAGLALAGGTTVAWGRCVEAEGSPAFWPWRQVLRSLGVDADMVLGGEVESPEDRFRVFDGLAQSVLDAAGRGGLVVILDDVHWSDEPSLLVLRHLADSIAGAPLLVLATFRDVEPAGPLPHVLPDLLRSPATERLHLRGFGIAEVREQLARTTDGSEAADAGAVLDLTGGNPLFVREVARAIAEGTWRPDRLPRTVLDLVGARLDRVSAGCRRLVQAAAIVGRDFSLPLVAAALDEPVERCLPLVDEAVGYGLVDQVGDVGEYRFVHALTREAVEASLTTAGRIELHRAVAVATEATFAGDLGEHLSDIARHWAVLAPYGEAATARAWAMRAAADAVQRLAYEDGVRLYGSALALAGAATGEAERCRTLMALGRAAYFAGDVEACVAAAVAAADAAVATGSPTLLGDAALVLEVTADPAVNAVAERLCEQALTGLGHDGHEALRAVAARPAQPPCLLRRRRWSGRGVERRRPRPGPRLARRPRPRRGPAGPKGGVPGGSELMALASRTRSARAAMWGELWQVEALIERGELAAAYEGLAGLRLAAERVGGPVSAWHFDRVAACIAQAQGRFADAAAIGRRAFERMRPVEPGPARGGYFALHCALARHVGISDDVAAYVGRPFEPLPRFRTMGP